MTFRELLKLYKTGELPEDSKTTVESEIEKFEALSDYVFSDVAGENPAMNSMSEEYKLSSDSSSKEKDFSKAVRKQIHKAFIKLGAAVFVILLAIVLFIQFALSPIIDNLYYDPTKPVTIIETSNRPENESGSETSQFALDIQVFSELRMPLDGRRDASATSLGFGRYSIDISQNSFAGYQNVKPSVGGEIERGKMIFYNPDYKNSIDYSIKFAYNNNMIFYEALDDGTSVEISQDKAYKEQRQLFLEDMKEYDKDKIMKMQISFRNPVSFSKLVEIINKYRLMNAWAPVDVSKIGEDYYIEESLGFSFDIDGSFLEFDKGKYPYLYLMAYDEAPEDENIMKQHFLSMLKYMRDQEQFIEMIDGDKNLDEYSKYSNIYEYALDYVEKNGFNMIGCAAYVTRENAEKMINDGVAYDIKLMDLSQQ